MNKNQITKEFKKLIKKNPCACYGDLTTAERSIVIKYIISVCENNDFALTVFLSEFLKGYKFIVAYDGIELFQEA